MTGMMFAVMWLIIAAYLFYAARTEEPFFYVIAPFFLFLGGWALANELSDADLMAGGFLWIYRGVAGVMLLICGIKYISIKKNR